MRYRTRRPMSYFLRALFFLGIFAPAFRASESPMAIRPTAFELSALHLVHGTLHFARAELFLRCHYPSFSVVVGRRRCAILSPDRGMDRQVERA